MKLLIKKTTAVMVTTLALLLVSGCAGLCRMDGPYEGRVVDGETKQPLEGVVVLAVWYKYYPNVAGSSSEFYDSVELRTDKKGEFKIPGKGLLLFSYLDEADFIIFKAGYGEFGFGPWSSFKTRTGRKFVRWDGDIPTFLMQKLSYEERRHNIPSRPGIEQKRQQLLTDEINKERTEFGFNPL